MRSVQNLRFFKLIRFCNGAEFSTKEEEKTQKENEAKILLMVEENKFKYDVLRIRALKASMKNPASFELVQAIRLDDGTLCVTYRGTNSFNAIVVDFAAIKDTQIIDYKSACAGKYGESIQHLKWAI